MIKYLDKASKAYYSGSPIIDDDTFDRLSEIYPAESMGCKEGESKHYNQLYSLDKVYNKEDIKLDVSKCIISPKLDGLAISLLYVEGKLEKAITRGDGKIGKDVTSKLKYIVPNNIDRSGISFIVGEIVANKEIDNCRNYAAGSINLKSTGDFALRIKNLAFVAYSLSPTNKLTFLEDMAILTNLGLTTVLTVEADKFLTDGTVYRVNNNKDHETLGYTAKFPRGSIALKSRQEAETKVTTILDVVWQLGASGALTPVAILDPIILEDAKVSKASLHNAGFVEDMNIEIGSKVYVQRAGHIIPKIIGLVK